MPFTAAHPAAVLPLRRLCPAWLSWPALVVGSLTPDLDYFLTLDMRSGTGHTLAGVFSFCLPLGLVIWIVFERLIKRPATLFLPARDRALLWKAACQPAPLSPAGMARAAASIVAGAWTHIAWDSFTHANRLGTRLLPVLDRTLLWLGDYRLSVYQLLQHLSTLAGLALIAYAYRGWRSRATEADPPPPHLRSAWRRTLIAAWLLAPGAAATWFVARSEHTVERVVIVHFVIAAIAFASLALLAVSLFVLKLEKRLVSQRPGKTAGSEAI